MSWSVRTYQSLQSHSDDKKEKQDIKLEPRRVSQSITEPKLGNIIWFELIYLNLLYYIKKNIWNMLKGIQIVVGQNMSKKTN